MKNGTAYTSNLFRNKSNVNIPFVTFTNRQTSLSNFYLASLKVEFKFSNHNFFSEKMVFKSIGIHIWCLN